MSEFHSDMMYRLLVQGVTDYAIYMLDPDGTVTNWNAGAERAKGYQAHEIIGKNFSCFYDADDRAQGLPTHNLTIARQTGRFEAEGWRKRKDGSRFWAHVVIDAVHDNDGTLIGFAKITRDRTEQRRASLALQQSKDNLDLTLANIKHGTCLLNADQRIVTHNAQFAEIWRRDRSYDLKDKSLADVFGIHTAAAIEHKLLLPAIKDGSQDYETATRDRIITASARALSDGGWVATFEDVTDRRKVEARILHMAHHDALTGLSNRAALLEALKDMFDTSRDSPCALIYIDLDRFKPVNDTLGHKVGDGVLQEVANRLKHVARPQDLVCRIGGDEFAILCTGRTGRPLASHIAERILLELNRPFLINNLFVTIGGSIGIARSPIDATDPDMLLQNADLALYDAKQSGRNCIRCYRLELSEKVIRQRTLELRLRHAFAHQAFSLHYQPVVALKDDTVVGFEALIRWKDSDGKFVPPSDFIPLAEELGLMIELGRWVLRDACATAAKWPAHLTVAVNVSAIQLRDPGFTDMVRTILAETGLAPHRLELELTETAIITDVPLISGMLTELRAMNVNIALDDFGTGFSSLSFLQTLPFSRIKLDRSFVRGIETGSRSHKIIRGILRLCADLGIDVTAEGVETASERALLDGEQCGYFQGYLCSPALPVSELGPFLRHVSNELRAAF